MCARQATAGSAVERTLLMASLLSPARLWSSIRPLASAEAEAVAKELRNQLGIDPEHGCRGLWNRVVAHAWYNTSASRADRDGAVWQGKGLTMSVTGGLETRRGPVTVALAPLAAYSENRSFAPSPAPATPGDYRDPNWGNVIDLPYRFGSRPVARIDPGESFVRVDARHGALSITAQSQQWGPAHFYPLLLGTEGPGYPRVLAETRRLPIWIGRISGQWHIGLLEASTETGLPVGQRSRVASAATASFIPRGFPGLELGGTRLFHVRRSPGALSWSTATLPFSGLLKAQSRDATIGGYNQLVSVFFRMAPPGRGIEAYGELLRDDHNADLRDLAIEPDHASAFTIGARRVWASNGRMDAVTIEHANARFSHLNRVRGQSPLYTHSSITEGHTFRGQPLGSSIVFGGQGMGLSWSRVAASRAFDAGIEIRSTAQNEEGGNLNGRQSGVYLMQFGEQHAVGAKRCGGRLELQLGYGGDGRTNVSLGFSCSN